MITEKRLKYVKDVEKQLKLARGQLRKANEDLVVRVRSSITANRGNLRQRLIKSHYFLSATYLSS